MDTKQAKGMERAGQWREGASTHAKRARFHFQCQTLFFRLYRRQAGECKTIFSSVHFKWIIGGIFSDDQKKPGSL